MRKTLILFLLLILILSLIFSSCTRSRREERGKNISSIELGMSSQEVAKLIGEPDSKRDLGPQDKQMWIYIIRGKRYEFNFTQGKLKRKKVERAYGKIDREAREKNISAVKVGMSLEEAAKLIGEPDFKSTFGSLGVKTQDIWFYEVKDRTYELIFTQGKLSSIKSTEEEREKNISAIKVGMLQGEVLKLIGEPDSQWGSDPLKHILWIYVAKGKRYEFEFREYKLTFKRILPAYGKFKNGVREKSISSIDLGMSPKKVAELLGEPDFTTFNPRRAKIEGTWIYEVKGKTYELWFTQDRLSSISASLSSKKKKPTNPSN